jgi:Transposase DDE domain
LVAEHLNSADSVAAGIRALPGVRSAFASTQAAWRFYGNARITLEQLAAPLLEAGREALADSAGHYALIAHDWSHLDYSDHGSKKDRARLKGKNLWGYELATALVLSDQTGAPLSVLCQSVEAADGLHSTRSEEVLPAVSQLDGLSDTIRFVDSCELGKPTVHIGDRECDSVGHYRQWQHEQHFFIVRAKLHRIVKHEGREQSLRTVVKKLQEQQGFRYSREVEFKGWVAKQYVAETTVVIARPAKPHRTRHGPMLRRIPGEAITLRLVVSRIEDREGKVLAEWLLWTNVPAGELPEGVTDEQIAQWYYWRWRIESFFKLLKSTGHSVEHWQQETADAIAKRLLVATMACVVVWQLARSPEPQADALRQLLVRLSGRQMKRGTPFTAPALLAGLGVLLVMLDVIEQYEVEEIKRLARIFLPGSYPLNL